MSNIFDFVDDTWNFGRFNGWTFLIASGPYEYYSDKENAIKTHAIPDSIAGVVNVKSNPRIKINPYMAPEVIRNVAKRAYIVTHTHSGIGETGSSDSLRFLESKGMLSFVSAPITSYDV